ncbi:DUF6907 domain-containing protein [Haloechinothrix salitolerans]|uniref:DUF6907 domain-containing protein n=1 Tax=Haloechinothrix salitolerans TaxID=926830 RepID=A0ABW2BWY0_9PSEU
MSITDSARCPTWCADGGHPDTDGTTYHKRHLGTAPVRANDLAPSSEPRRDAPLVAGISQDETEPAVITVAVDGWAECIVLGVDDARRLISLLVEGVVLAQDGEAR